MDSFFKMQGIGNDYVYFDALDGRSVEPSPEQIRRIADRRFGVGGDGVVVIAPSERGAARMRMWNADGSASDMCGNALRCIAFYVARKTGEREFLLESGCGLHETRVLELNGNHAEVEIDLGRPRFEAREIPFDAGRFAGGLHAPFVEIPISLGASNTGVTQAVTVLSMGNPHCVLFVDDADAAPVAEWGPLLEVHPAFPERTNVEFVSREKDNSGWYQRTFERGSGETLACGSGACAVLVAAVLAKGNPREDRIRLRGGALHIRWAEDDRVFMRGPATLVYQGALSADLAKSGG